jgi:hypothetical protein
VDETAATNNSAQREWTVVLIVIFLYKTAPIVYGTVRFMITSAWPAAARVALGPRNRRLAFVASRTFSDVSRWRRTVAVLGTAIW